MRGRCVLRGRASRVGGEGSLGCARKARRSGLPRQARAPADAARLMLPPRLATRAKHSCLARDSSQ